MQIDTNIATQANGVPAKGSSQAVAPAPVTVPVAKLDTTSFHQSLDLEKDLEQSDDARAEKVERALNLIRSGSIPSRHGHPADRQLVGDPDRRWPRVELSDRIRAVSE